MKKVKRLIAVLAVVIALVSGAVTVYAMSAEGERKPASSRANVLEDCVAEEMAIGAYYEGQLEEEGV